MKKDSTRTGASLCSSMMPRSATTSWLNKFKLLAFAFMALLSINQVWGAAATLPVDYSFGNGKSSLPTGVTQDGLGSDYAASNSPYRLKFDGNGDYIQIQVDGAASAITIGIKQYGTDNPSFQIKGSSDGSSFTLIETLAFTIGQNKTGTKTTTKSISSDYRYFRIIKSAGGNAGLGTLVITKAAPSTFSVTYNANGATSGSVPTDATAYSSGASVTVLGNTGNLVKTDKKFGGWNTNSGGTGTTYQAGGTFNISANTTLYAKWDNVTYTDLSSGQKSGHFQPSFLALSQIVIWGFFAFFCKKVFHIRCMEGAWRMHGGSRPSSQPLFSPFGTLFAIAPTWLIPNWLIGYPI
ncbi:MAG: InlB B-repeat-containing protein [Bacteroidales bacterium]|nr:InlB B-repeat-containing protein [Candidatus Colicola equi]